MVWYFRIYFWYYGANDIEPPQVPFSASKYADGSTLVCKALVPTPAGQGQRAPPGGVCCFNAGASKHPGVLLLRRDGD